jgi:hypothetical protein
MGFVDSHVPRVGPRALGRTEIKEEE